MSLEWGTITWFLFHTLAEKIKDTSYVEKKDELLKIIILICHSLPCPDCQEHAKETLKYLKKNTLNTKEDFQKMLWSFHNLVNRRRRVPAFNFEECKVKYEKANLNVILNNFYIIWSQNYRVMKLMGDSFNRDMTLKHVRKWMETNSQHFDM
jgi:hypothetical protein